MIVASATGSIVTFTTLVPAHPLSVIVTVYAPVAAKVTAGIVGFCKADVNPFGPVHAKVAVPPPVAVKFNVEPSHIGALDPAVVVGKALTVTLTVDVDVQPLFVIVTV